jgi:hypothetical protein
MVIINGGEQTKEFNLWYIGILCFYGPRCKLMPSHR